MLFTRILRHISLTFLLLSSTQAEDSKLIKNLNAGKSQVVVTYGTSLTAGGAWVGQVQGALAKNWPKQIQVINSGQGAMWSTWGVEHLEERVIAKKPDTVFIEFAINDAFLEYKTSVEVAQKNLEKMIDRISAAKPETEIILMTMNPPTAEHFTRRPDYLKYYAMYRSVAKDKKLKLIDHTPSWDAILAGDPAKFKKYMPDGIHPNIEGCKEVITPLILSGLGVPEAKAAP